MDLTKDIIDFTQKVEFSDIKGSDAKMLNANEFGVFNVGGNCENITDSMISPTAEANKNKVEIKTPTEKLQKPTTPQLIENVANMSTIKAVLSGNISPPPRPLTSSEVVGFTTALDDPEMQLDPTVALNKSRSLPASPNHLKSSHIAELFTFGGAKPLNLPTKPTAIIADKKIPNIIKGHAEAIARNNQQFCLRWNNYQTNLTNVFDELLQSESFVDVTLACEGQSIKAHKMILSACSPYFQALFYDNPCQHPIVIMRDVRWQELKALMEFMYKGEINVSQDQINPLLKVAEMLKIRGLAEVNTAGGSMAAQQLIPEQRMTVYDEDDEDEDNVDNDDLDNGPDDGSGCPKAKRPRIQVSQKVAAALDLNLPGQRMRKRSRDGLMINDDDRLATRPLSRSESPQIREKDTASPTPPIAMTASTIVRNPFASPNPSNQPVTSNTCGTVSTSSSSSSSASGTSVSSASSNSVALAYRPRERSCSPVLITSHTSGTGNTSLASPTSNSASQISIHPHPASAAAAALANPHHPHHHAAAAAQQFAAQHQLHAAAQSHAAMASALGASLAAAAAGAGSVPGGPGSSAGSSSHHDDMEIKPEIAEMIREEERVSDFLSLIF